MPNAALKGRVVSAMRGLWVLAVLLAPELAPAAAPFFFIQLTDPQFGMFTDNTNFTQETANFEFAVATVNRLRPAFVIVTGDLVNKPGDAAQIAEYRRIVGQIDRSIPVYDVAGNHDVENVPTPASIAGYTNLFGADHYTFRHSGLVGIVLNSSVIHSPQRTTEQLVEQERWLRKELEQARDERARHIVIFQHHPWFLSAVDEPDQYFNIPRERRAQYLSLFREFGVKYLFSGHYHRNAVAHDGELEAITTGPVGKPLDHDKSGLRIAIVRDEGIEHRYYHFGEVPNQVDLRKKIQ
jgi:3',5'-cyclic AMP phosphodiesterase CpdA